MLVGYERVMRVGGVLVWGVGVCCFVGFFFLVFFCLFYHMGFIVYCPFPSGIDLKPCQNRKLHCCIAVKLRGTLEK